MNLYPFPITTMKQVDLLNQDEMVEGYMYGVQHKAAPNFIMSASFYHGYQNAMTDYGIYAPNENQRKLAKDYRNGQDKTTK